MNILIVDDEQPARDRLRRLLDESGAHIVVGEASNGREAVEKCAQLKPDLVLLDIRMPGMSGLEAAQHINELESPPAIVFATAYDEYAIEAFDANAIGYVLKPVRPHKLEKALGQAARVTRSTLDTVNEAATPAHRRSHICARTRGALLLIPVETIAYFHADQKYVRVHCADKQPLIDESLKSLEEEFADTFVRIHRSALVAVSHIAAVEKTTDGHSRVVLRDSDRQTDELIISRRHLADVNRRIKGV